jgi:tol-pal system protein YbgF
MKRLALSAALLLTLSACATTSDIEATRYQIDQVNRQASARLTEVENKLSNEKLLEMVNQMESLKAEVAKLRGEVEVANYNLQTTQKRQNDLYNDLDGRLSHLESAGKEAAAQQNASQPASGQPAAADTQTSPDYDKALNLLRARDFANATTALSLYIQQNPNAPQAIDALYWLGVAHTAQRQYDAAIEIHRRFAEQYPDNPKAPDALRNVANCQRDLGQVDIAKTTLKRLIKLYPSSSAAQKAREQLTKM